MKHTFWGFFFEVFELWNVRLQTGHKHLLHHGAAFRLGTGHLSRNAAVKPGMHSAANTAKVFLRYEVYILCSNNHFSHEKSVSKLGFHLDGIQWQLHVLRAAAQVVAQGVQQEEVVL